MKVIEVIVTSDHKIEEKRALCQKLGIEFLTLKSNSDTNFSYRRPLLRAISNPFALRILEELRDSDLSYTLIAERIGLNLVESFVIV